MKRLCLALFFCAAQAKAEMQMRMAMEPGARANITIGCCFDNPPPTGYAPLTVTINNFSGAAQRWNFDFARESYPFASTSSMYCHAAVAVENNAERAIALLTPLGADTDGMTPLTATIRGYGFAAGASQSFPEGARSGQPVTQYIVLSKSLGSKLWSSIEQSVKDSKHQLIGSLVDPQNLPEDWRGLSGVSVMWLTGAELDLLSPAQRRAVRDWVRAGGALKLCGAADFPRDFQPPGFGDVQLARAPLEADAVAAAAWSRAAPREGIFGAPSMRHPAGFAPVAPNVPVLIGFMVLFAAVAGPVNIFAFAGRRRRHRLFWTTPLLSLSASGLLVVFILLQDGMGGKGVRSAVIHLVPREHCEVLVQEQTSRTGLLLGSAFETRDPALIQQISDELRVGRAHKRSLQTDGSSYGGDWFASRALQTQRIIAVIPTRGEISLLNAREMQQGDAPPVILSSFSSALDEIVYLDSRHRKWKGTDVRTGVKQTLVPTNAGPALADADTFSATARDPSAFIGTLQSIRWQDQPVTYLGPVTTP